MTLIFIRGVTYLLGDDILFCIIIYVIEYSYGFADGVRSTSGEVRYTRDRGKILWIAAASGVICGLVGLALWLEQHAEKSAVYDSPVYRSSTDLGYVSKGGLQVNRREAYLSDGTPFKFYVIGDNIAMYELDGKPVVDFLEGKLGK